MKTIKITILLLSIIGAILFSCKKDAPSPQEEKNDDTISLEEVSECLPKYENTVSECGECYADTIDVICPDAYTEHNIKNSDETLIVPSAFTPNNYPFYDEIAIEGTGTFRGKPIVISEDLQDTSETGRPSPDSMYNDTINRYFHIENIEAFPYNKIFFHFVDDELLYREPYINCKNKRGTVFDGRYNIRDTSRGDILVIPAYLPSGKYKYSIVLFKDERWTQRIDSVTGYFYIVRTPCYRTFGCRGADENDPLLMN